RGRGHGHPSCAPLQQGIVAREGPLDLPRPLCLRREPRPPPSGACAGSDRSDYTSVSAATEIRVSAAYEGPIYWPHEHQWPSPSRREYLAAADWALALPGRPAAATVDGVLSGPWPRSPADLPALWDQQRHVVSLVAAL